MNKYRNKKVIVDDFVFDSIQESRRYKGLKLLLKAGQIQNLKLHPRFLLLEGVRKNGRRCRQVEDVADLV